MKAHVEAWARYCATHKYSVRMTIEQAIARNRAVLSVATWGPKCEVCGGLLQVGYKVLLPTETPRSYTVGYVHIHPDWCQRTTEAKRLMEAVEAAFRDVDRELRAGAQFDNALLAVSSRIALAWIGTEPPPQWCVCARSHANGARFCSDCGKPVYWMEETQ